MSDRLSIGPGRSPALLLPWANRLPGIRPANPSTMAPLIKYRLLIN